MLESCITAELCESKHSHLKEKQQKESINPSSPGYPWSFIYRFLDVQ